MNLRGVEEIANAVLYERYLLYPYRPSSVKNRQRWTFGGVYPRAYSEAQRGSDAWLQQTECLIGSAERRTRNAEQVGDERSLFRVPRSAFRVKVRFLHLLAREVGELGRPLPDLPPDREPPFRAVERLAVGERIYTTWQEAVEREVGAPPLDLGELVDRPYRGAFAFPARRDLEALRGPTGEVVGVLVRRQAPVEGALEVAAARVGEGLFKVTTRVLNTTPFVEPDRQSRDDALPRSFVSTHAILGAHGDEFVSLLDPPEDCREAAAGCVNTGAWPVLVGDEGQRDTMLSSPIILYDYPQIAPESPGDLFDGTEIDEILTLRILAMTDEEKREMRQIDERARALLDRTETLSGDQLLQLHGSVRSLRPLTGPGLRGADD